MSKEQSPLQGLIQQYGLDNIPDEALASIGYFREAIEGGSRIRLINRPKTEYDLQMETKIQNSPFPPVEITLSEGNFAYRGIYTLEEESKLMKKLFDIRVWENANEKTIKILRSYANSEPIQMLFTSFREYVRNNPPYQTVEEKGIEHVLFNDWTLQSLTSYLDNVTTLGNIENFVNAHRIEDGDDISPALAQVMYDNLEREKGSVADLTEIEEMFLYQMKRSLVNDNIPTHNPKLYQYSKKLHLKTCYQVATHFFERFLEHNNIHVPKLLQTKNPTEAIALLQKLELNQELSLEEKQLRLQLKSATVEERITINSRLKEIGKTKKWRRQIQEGLLQYFQFPALLVETIKRNINNVQQFLVTGNTASTIESTIILDPTPDKQYDANPGKVSGDCTEGEPLPFKDPDIPVYNVKVFSEARDHIGNIYLLMTRTMGSKKPVWHLEAIQIPKRTYVWNSVIPALLAPMVTAAQEKNIWGITVNFKDHHISNYDFAQQATIKFHESQGLGETDVVVPRVNNKLYSEFQSAGHARILWKNSAYQE